MHMKTQTIKRKSTRHPGPISINVGFALMCSIIMAMADDLIVNSFDTSISGIDWQNFRSYAYGYSEVWAPTQDSGGNPNSGSMYLTVNWPLHNDPNWNQNWNDVQIAFYTGSFNPADYVTYEIDVKVDVTNSFAALDGTFGALELIINNPWTTVVGWAPLIATNGWQHVKGYFSGIPSGTNSEAVIGFISNGTSSLTNTVNYWIDNIVFTAPPSVHTNRPSLTVAPAPKPGLTCVASQPGGTYQRQMIATVNSDYSWNTATAVSNTTTYSMSIDSFPAANYTGFTAQMFLIPKAGMIGSPIDDSIDWDSSDAVSFFIGVNPDRSATATFQYKTNNPSSWNTALLVTKNCAAGPLGKWTVTFNKDTNVTLTAPDLTSTNFTIPPSDAAFFADPLYVYLGTQPNNNGNIGQSATFSRLTVAGSAGAIDDNFVSNGTPGQPYLINTNIWTLNTADPNGVFVTAPDAKYWISWPLPDTGFTNLYATDNLTNKLSAFQWVNLPASATGWLDIGGVSRFTVVNQSTLNAAFSHPAAHSFFGLFHQ
jgi:hypothetical protein